MIALTYAPTISVFLFLMLFLYCTSLYPGSSQHDVNSIGFSWQHNYWCDIMDKETYGEVHNPARNWGIFATVILCVGTGLLFYQFPEQFGANKNEQWIISGFGLTSMFMASLIFTSLHNQVIGLSTGLAFIALLSMFYLLFKQEEWSLFYYGLFACFIMLMNNYIYYSKHGIDHLPWIQKISIVIVLVWIVMINIQCIQKGA